MAQETRDTPSAVYRSLNSPRKPSVTPERQPEPKSAGSRVLGWLSTLVAILGLIGIVYWALSRPQASLPDRLGRYARLENQSVLEQRTAAQYQVGATGDVQVAVYGNKRDRVIMTLFVDQGSRSLDAFAAARGGTNAQALQDPKVFAAVRRGGGTVRCVSGGVPTPYLSQCVWQEGGTFAILTTTEPDIPIALKLATVSRGASITSRLEGLLGSFVPAGARATVSR